MGDWFVGQRVVCVERHAKWRVHGWSMRWRDWRGRVPRPVERAIYRVAGFGVSKLDGQEYLLLAELPARYSYQATGFRPLVDSSNDIGVLQALLAPRALVASD